MRLGTMRLANLWLGIMRLGTMRLGTMRLGTLRSSPQYPFNEYSLDSEITNINENHQSKNYEGHR